MLLVPGTRLGVYEVVAAIGAGGMGEVYRARDAKLGRDVAIKVLPSTLTQDPERLARFSREAQVLASLNHPNIGAIHHVEETSDGPALVMELVEGETLADRIAGGPIPIDEALPIARQIAEALEAAHEQGIIHRDLKPANIKIRADGAVKVLDFGLAKLTESTTAPATPNLSMSPTITSPALMSGVGVLLGTAAYMSPEQAKGKPADKRSDIWAFGCVLYEMLTETRAFAGDDVTDTLAALLRDQVDWSALPSRTPREVATLLRRCLERDIKNRLPDIAIARIEIDDAMRAATTAAPSGDAQRKGSVSRRRLTWAVAAVATIAIGVATFAYVTRTREATEEVRFEMAPPAGATWAAATGGANGLVSMSPDGRRLAFLATNAAGKTLVWIRAVNALEPKPLAGTEGATWPFWSPDGRFIAFFAEQKLKKIDVSGGPPVTICATSAGVDLPRGGTWAADGTILFASVNPQTIQQVSAAGGTPTPVTVVEPGESTHREPLFLPDGQHFLYSASIGGTSVRVYVATLGASDKNLLDVFDASNVGYSRGYLLFIKESTLMAQRFDQKSLSLIGERIPLISDIELQSAGPPAGVFSASASGVLAYRIGNSPSKRQLVWLDRTGRRLSVLGDPADYADIQLSPDGTRLVAAVEKDDKKGRDLWLYDLSRGARTRFTVTSTSGVIAPVWSPDGHRIIFTRRANERQREDLYVKDANGGADEGVLLHSNDDKRAYGWSPDGRYVVYQTFPVGATGVAPSTAHLWVLPLNGDRTPIPLLHAPSIGFLPTFSPDGKWVAFTSDKSGREEVYVAQFPSGTAQSQLSVAGGSLARWKGDGKHIFYVASDHRLMIADVSADRDSFHVSRVAPVFETPIIGLGTRYMYDVTPDGQRFLVVTLPEASGALDVDVNWDARLHQQEASR